MLDVIEREIDQEARAHFPGTAVRRAVLLQYGDDPEIGPGDLWVRVLLDAAGPEDYAETLVILDLANQAARDQFRATRQQAPGESRWSSTRSATTPSPATATDPARAIPSGSHCQTSRSGSTARQPACWPGWDRLAWKPSTR